ncbi:MAG: ABC transporter ATP-binding protein, partial [Oceanisphaera sp.]|nr:ABC transporter ATP-binding protein [Oceanisphaera sp.]
MLEIKNLKTGYGDRTVLDGISMQVAQGEILAVIGPNGAGKSTLIRAISGVIGHQGGGVNYLGEDILGLSNLRRARILAVVPQARQVGGAFTVEQTVMMGRTPYLSWLGNPTDHDHLIVRQALEQTQISELAHRKNAELSGGEQQRVLLARALAQQTPVLLLDEPT